MMTRGDIIRPEPFSPVYEELKLDMLIAADAWVRSPAPAIFQAKIGNDGSFKFSAKIYHKMRNPEPHGYLMSVFCCLPTATAS
jgi:hypothetical protein